MKANVRTTTKLKVSVLSLAMATPLGCGEQPPTLARPVASSPSVEVAQPSPAPTASATATATPAAVRLGELRLGADLRCGGFEARGRERLPVMLDRFSVEAPRGSADIPKAYNIMSAPEPQAHESRLLLEVNGQKFVVYIKELFQIAGRDVDSAAATYFAEYHEHPMDDFDIGVVATKSPGVRILAARPKANMMVSEDARLVLSTIVENDDHTLQSMDFYVSPSVADSGCGDFAATLARTSLPGKRKLESGGGKRSLPSGGATIDLEVPAGFVVTTKPGPDFFVHLVRKLAPLGEYPGHLLLYLGDHPDLSVPEGDPAVARDGELNGVKTPYKGFESPERAALVATVPATHQGGNSLQLQVRLSATLDAKFIDELMLIANTVRVR